MTPKIIVAESTLVKERQQGLALITPLKSKVTVMVVETAEDYEKASAILQQISQAESSWQYRMNPIIEPIRAGLDLLYALRKDILDPLAELKSMLKERMRAFKLKEAKELQEAEEAKQEALRKALAEARAKELAASKARTSQLRERLEMARAEAEQRASAIEHTEAPTPVKSAGSQARKVKKWQVVNMAKFLEYVIHDTEEDEAEEDLISLIMVDTTQMNAYFKMQEPKVGEWMPGIAVYDDITIAGRK